MTDTKRQAFQSFSFEELLTSEGLDRLDKSFLAYLQEKEPLLSKQLLLYRNNQLGLNDIETSDWLIKLAIYLEMFLAEFFAIGEELAISRLKTTSFTPIALFKKYYVLKRAKKEMNRAKELPDFQLLDSWLEAELKAAAIQSPDKELAIALLGQAYLQKPDENKDKIDQLVAWCTHVLIKNECTWSIFRLPQRIDHANLVEAETTTLYQNISALKAKDEALRERDGFTLTDPRMSEREVLDEVHYCIYCHDHEGDFCSKGFPVKKGDPTQGFKKNPQDLILTGCPLEEKISEMQLLKRDGYTIASLAMIMIDNPMCPATGHRICNDCMKACIYQKQTPVNIPQIETRALTDVLDLPYGVEIYDLLTRWHPLRQSQWVMKPYNGLKILIAGMGPAGFTLAHHLLLEGFAVVGVDGLKIEPLPNQLLKQPIHSYAKICESLDERIMAGFGGVAEYGITVRWDKNFLKLIYISLMRKLHFQVFGGVRFGGTITIESAFELGFDHVAVAVGAGLPRALHIPNSMAPYMRQANDFLMALQLGNAAKKMSLNHLEVRLPALVIGGGLTGVDTATEVQAYYVTQVEKILYRYEKLTAHYGADAILNAFNQEAKSALEEYLSHAKEILKEKNLKKKNKPALIPLLKKFGGVAIVYRKSLQESPAYIFNHEELQNAFKEGIYYIENKEPKETLIDEKGLVKGLKVADTKLNSLTDINAKSIFVATGTQPNTAYEFEHKGTFNRLQLQYQHYEDVNDTLHIAHGITHPKEKDFGPFTSYQKNGKRVSLIGDTHPVFHGNVVKAIASGMRTYPKILALFKDKLPQTGDEAEYRYFVQKLNDNFRTKVVAVTRKSHHFLELTVLAPVAAKQFKPGQFFRLQNLETNAATTDDTLLQMEAIPLTPAACDAIKGLLTFIIKEESASSRIAATLKVDETIALMGPTGVRAKISDKEETILLVGGADSFSFVRSYGNDARKNQNRLIFLCEIKEEGDLFCQAELEEATDQIIWVTADNITIKTREHDQQIINKTLIDALIDYQKANLDTFISLKDVDRMFIIGTSALLKSFQTQQQTKLKNIFIKGPKIFGAVYGNMQCMLKGVCAQCLQWQINPETGERTKAVFACSWQDQPLELIDVSHFATRQKPSLVLETLNQLWLNYLYDTKQVKRI